MEKRVSFHDYVESDGVVEEFTIDDMSKADWALRKLRELKEEKRKNEEFAEKEKQRINSWLEQENGKLDRSIEFFEYHLKSYGKMIRHEKPKFKTLSLPNGKLKYRKKADWKYDDELLLLSLKQLDRCDLIRTRIKEEIDKSRVKKAFSILQDGRVVDEETGEVIDGVTVEVREEIKVEVVE